MLPRLIYLAPVNTLYSRDKEPVEPNWTPFPDEVYFMMIKVDGKWCEATEYTVEEGEMWCSSCSDTLFERSEHFIKLNYPCGHTSCFSCLDEDKFTCKFCKTTFTTIREISGYLFRITRWIYVSKYNPEKAKNAVDFEGLGKDYRIAIFKKLKKSMGFYRM